MKCESQGGSKGCLISIVSMVNKDDVFARDLWSSIEEDIDYIDLVIVRDAPSGGRGLNEGIDHARGEVVLCAHQDVHLAPNWLHMILTLLGELPRPWGVAGAAGTTDGGHMHGTHSGLKMGGARTIRVQTLDESTLIFRKDTGLRFDDFGHFHMYGADLCLQAEARGLPCFAIALPMEHRTKWTAGGGFLESSRRMREKWRNYGPIHTTVGTF